MIKVVFHPHAFRRTPAPDGTDATPALMIALLRNIMELGLVFVDAEHEMLSAIGREVDRWPQQEKSRIFELFKILQKRKRIQKRGISFTAIEQYCDISRQLEIEDGFVSIVVHENCACELGIKCLRCHTLWQVDFQDRVQDQLVTSRFTHPRGVVSRQQFENEWLADRLRYSHRLRIVDPQIGKTAHRRSGDFQIGTGFDRGVKWLITRFLKYSREPRRIDIYTHVSEFLDHAEHKALIECMKNWESELKILLASSNLQINVKVKQSHNSNSPALDHDRYLITDQFTVNMTRGFDLFLSNGRDMAGGAAISVEYDDRYHIEEQFQNATAL